MTGSTPDDASGTLRGPARARALGAAAALIAAACLFISARDAYIGVPAPTPFAGQPAISGPWAAPQAASGRWLVSAGVTPPAASASPTELESWLQVHYPVLLVARHGQDAAAGQHALDLGGGPPRRLFLEAGVGLIMEEPESWYQRAGLPRAPGQASHD